jgi:ribosomal protein S27E
VLLTSGDCHLSNPEEIGLPEDNHVFGERFTKSLRGRKEKNIKRKKHKKKRLVQSTNSYFTGAKCCYKITMVFSHIQVVLYCAHRLIMLYQPTG